MSRYNLITKNRKNTINDIYENKSGNFFACITVKNYKAKMEICGDAASGIIATIDMLYDLCKKTGLSKENVFDVINKVWEEHDDSEFNDN